MTTHPGNRWSLGVTPTMLLLGGIAIGWALASPRQGPLQAGAGDRAELPSGDESLLTTGPAYLSYNVGSKVQVAQDAVYILDYRAGKLFGTIPRVKASMAGSKPIDTFAERDLVADFKLDTDTGPPPRFQMKTGSMSNGSATGYGDGWAALYVMETTTRQLASYKIDQTQIGAKFQIKFELLDVRPYGPRPATTAR